MKKIFAVFVVIFQIVTISTSGLGKCPIHLLMDNFNITQLCGKWYEIRHSFYLPDLTFGCTTITLEEVNQSQTQITVKTINQWTGNPIFFNGSSKLEDPNIPKMNIIFQTRLPSAIARFLPGTGLYQILYTDYKTFTILYLCTNYNFAYTDKIWLFGRERELSNERLEKATQIIQDWDLDASRMVKPKYKFCNENM